MKLRFRNNSLRLRVNQREVRALAGGNALEEHVSFPGEAQISYILQPTGRTHPDASFQQGVIRVFAPQTEVELWAAGDSIGMYFELPANGLPLKVAIEKDLECMENAPEGNDPEAFPRLPGTSC